MQLTMKNTLLLILGLVYSAHLIGGGGPSLFLPDVKDTNSVATPMQDKALNGPKLPSGYRSVQLNQSIFNLKTGDALQFEAPSGEVYEITFEKVVRTGKTSTWVGYAGKKMFRVLITQRGKAVAGRILTPGGVFILKFQDGKLFVVDRKKAGLKRAPPNKNDAIARPKPEDNREPAPIKLNSNSEKAGSSSKTIIDVLILYNGTFASRYPGDQLRAKLDYFIDLSNQAFTDSNAHIKLRIAHAQEVSYSNTNDHYSALDAIEYNTIPGVDIDALRASKRADLVTIIRPYDENDHDYCGLGNLMTSLLQTDAVYSSVSEGSDVTYYCNDYTLVHELGHNMGSHHDRANASGPGLYAYSYGYGIDGTFGTIMSYLDPVVGFFSNPNILCAGITCGVPSGDPNAADNTLSLNNVRSTISQFMTAIVADDFGGDGKADILVRHSSGHLYMYEMDGNIKTGSNIGGLSTDWTVAGIGDFGGDGKADILIRHSSGHLYMYEMDGNIKTGSNIGGLSTDWTVAGIGDFGGDGKDDILIRHSSGHLYMYEMDGNIKTGSNVGGLGVDWAVAGVGDFGGDGKADILIRHSSGLLYLYEMDGNIKTGSNVGGLGTDWTVEGIGDFGGDGKDDILIRHSSGLLYLYEMDGNIKTGSDIGGLSTDWSVERVADYGGDGKADILLRHAGGQLYLYEMDGNIYTGSLIGGLNTDWAVEVQ